MYLVSIIDSSEKDVRALRSILEGYFRRTGVTCVERVYQNGVDFIQSPEISDIVFLNAELEKLNGIETARILRRLGNQAQLIFTASSPEKAICGYEVDALDFLVKPLNAGSVGYAMDKALKRVESMTSSTLALKLQNGLASIPSNGITYVEVFDHNLVFHTVGGEFTVRGQLSRIYEALDHNRFILCSRSFLVNLHHVSAIRSDHLFVGTTKISISKSHRKEIASRFAAYLEKK